MNGFRKFDMQLVVLVALLSVLSVLALDVQHSKSEVPALISPLSPARTSRYHLSSEPPGALITVGGEEHSFAPAAFSVPWGRETRVNVSLAGYASWDSTLLGHDDIADTVRVLVVLKQCKKPTSLSFLDQSVSGSSYAMEMVHKQSGERVFSSLHRGYFRLRSGADYPRMIEISPSGGVTVFDDQTIFTGPVRRQDLKDLEGRRVRVFARKTFKPGVPPRVFTLHITVLD